MNKTFFKIIAKANKLLLPSYSKKQLDLSKASKIQLMIVAWRYFITKNSL
nr:SsrA-binding protein [Aureivirga marina]